ncbi:putative amid-like NADH oxidoreductase [Xylona heveae TC161]|uniref:Putative amid-like NADH oxidoreductase n=1 Tax=Xylona heveae (strain CBS 132557 / TC161) TaxID=1328760 RepID=A0A164ZQZ0_XYLHT|nr:putative amid-like NADH oxidoreductase [Xylona heveae TC161]KZF19397.1 putative amid-like NADH oxidoreductase [Xylona heveae TC161]
MLPTKLKFYGKFFVIVLKYAFEFIGQRIQAIIHKWTYVADPSAKNVVVLGGSFSGVFAAKRLAESLPTGYKVVLIEKNSHFNYTFNFPRYSVLQGHEQLAFVPYDGLVHALPQGSLQVVHDTALGLTRNEVELKSGEKISYDYLAIATGTLQPQPSKLLASTKDDACVELHELQGVIEAAARVAVVGGGAVGVELSTDIKSFYPDKSVTLIHSRDQLLPSFGRRLHEHVLDAMERLGVDVILNERPVLPSTTRFVNKETSLELKNGRVLDFDLVIPCTGQRPNSKLWDEFASQGTSSSTGRILVKPTLQVASEEHANIFVLGDVAETGGPKMARAGLVQSEVVRENIVRLIKDKGNLKEYTPKSIEGTIKLTLGKSDWVAYMKDGKDDLLLSGKTKDDDLGVSQIWKLLGADPKGVQ